MLLPIKIRGNTSDTPKKKKKKSINSSRINTASTRININLRCSRKTGTIYPNAFPFNLGEIDGLHLYPIED